MAWTLKTLNVKKCLPQGIASARLIKNWNEVEVEPKNSNVVQLPWAKRM